MRLGGEGAAGHRRCSRSARSRGLRAARVARRPPASRATDDGLGIVFAVAYVFVLRTPPSVPTPSISAISGTYVLERSVASDQPGSDTATGVPPAPSRRWPQATLTGPAADPPPSLHDGPGPIELVLRREAARRSSHVDVPRPRTSPRAPSAPGRRSGRSPRRARWTTRAWPPSCAPPSRTATAAVGIKPLKDGDRKVWRAAMTLDGSTYRARRRPADGTRRVVLAARVHSRPSATRRTGERTTRRAGDRSRRRAGRRRSGHARNRCSDPHLHLRAVSAAAGRAAGYAPLESDAGARRLRTQGGRDRRTRWERPAHWLGQTGTACPSTRLAGQRQVAQLYTRGLTWFTVQQLGPKVAGKSVGLLRDTLAFDRGRQAVVPDDAAAVRGASPARTAYTWYERTGPTLFVSDARLRRLRHRRPDAPGTDHARRGPRAS